VVTLVGALTALRAALDDADFPLAVPSAGPARRAAASIVRQIEDYLVPRLDRLDAPLLAVVGGSTGAGKSTLLNSLIGQAVSPSGVLRPTTRAPVLACHPEDAEWFTQARVLPTLVRGSGGLNVVATRAVGPGLALLDTPDIDSVVEANRALADEILAAADLWLFVTTAARYADAVPWAVLGTAHERGTAVALVLDRVPHGAGEQISAHLRGMLGERGFANVALFVVPEVALRPSALLPPEAVAVVRGWLDTLSGDAAARAEVIRTTLSGALNRVVVDIDMLAAAVDDQTIAWTALEDAARAAYGEAGTVVQKAVLDGAVLRGEVLARWQEFVGTGQMMRSLQSRIGRWRDAAVAAVTGRTPPATELNQALNSGLSALVRSAAYAAAERTVAAWQAHPAGTALLTPRLSRPDPDLEVTVDRMIRNWQQAVLNLVREEAAERRTVARVSAYAVNATGLLVMVAVFAATSFIPTGMEIGVAAGTTIAAQKVLEAIFGDEALRQLTRSARDDLTTRVGALLDGEVARYTAVGAALGLSVAPPGGGQAARIRDAGRAVERAIPAALRQRRRGLPAGVKPLPE
jgi:Dynamin family